MKKKELIVSCHIYDLLELSIRDYVVAAMISEAGDSKISKMTVVRDSHLAVKILRGFKDFFMDYKVKDSGIDDRSGERIRCAVNYQFLYENEWDFILSRLYYE